MRVRECILTVRGVTCLEEIRPTEMLLPYIVLRIAESVLADMCSTLAAFNGGEVMSSLDGTFT